MIAKESGDGTLRLMFMFDIVFCICATALHLVLLLDSQITDVLVSGVVGSYVAGGNVAEDGVIINIVGSGVTESVIIDVVETTIIESSDVSVEVLSVSEDVTIYNRIRKLLVSMRQ